MTRGLLLKAVREAGTVWLILAAALLAVEAIITAVLPTIIDQVSAQFLQIPFFRTILQALLGTDVGDMLVPEAIIALAWVHPVVLAIVWTYAIVYCTRVPAGEVDRGTADVLFGLPVSRWRVYAAETAVFLASVALLLVMGLLGHRLGLLFLDPGRRPAMGRLLIVALNFYCLILAVGGLASLVSAASDRRGRAIATVFGVLVASFLLNFLAQFWAPAEAISFLGLLNYYQPLAALRPGQAAAWPVADMAALLGFGAAAWAAGGWWFARRDICTV